MSQLNLLVTAWFVLGQTVWAKDVPKTSAPVTKTAVARKLVVAACSDTTGLNIAKELQTSLSGLFKDTGAFVPSITKDSIPGYEKEKILPFLKRHDASLASFVFLEKQRISIFLFDESQPDKYIASSEPVNADPRQKVNQADLENQYRAAFKKLVEHYDTGDFQTVQVAPGQGKSESEAVLSSEKNAAGGALLFGFSYLFPSVSYSRAISPSFVMGGQFGVMAVSGASESSFVFNGILHVDYYPKELFHRLWIRGGVALYRFSLTSSGLSETIWSPAVLSTVGWRWTMGEGISIGAGLGLHYIFKSTGTLFTLTMSGIQPLGVVDVVLRF